MLYNEFLKLPLLPIPCNTDILFCADRPGGINRPHLPYSILGEFSSSIVSLKHITLIAKLKT